MASALGASALAVHLKFELKLHDGARKPIGIGRRDAFTEQLAAKVDAIF